MLTFGHPRININCAINILYWEDGNTYREYFAWAPEIVPRRPNPEEGFLLFSTDGKPQPCPPTLLTVMHSATIAAKSSARPPRTCPLVIPHHRNILISAKPLSTQSSMGTCAPHRNRPRHARAQKTRRPPPRLLSAREPLKTH